jgi:hypothetical protein
MPLGLTPAARDALIDQRVSEALAGVMPELRDIEHASDQIRPTPDIDQLRPQRVPRGTTAVNRLDQRTIRRTWDIGSRSTNRPLCSETTIESHVGHR